VVKVDLQQGGRQKIIWLLGLAAIVAVVALGRRTSHWLGTPPASGSHPTQSGEQAREAAAGGGPRSRASAGSGRAAPPGEAAAPTPRTSFVDPEATGGPDERESDGQPEDGQEQAGQERTGVELFPAPGTKLIKRGIIVPDDFALPPGYVRHYQATDKGRMLQAILMFHPDHKPLDAAGNPVPVPPDRVVPPEMAPAGLPVELLEVPEDAYADTEDGGADPAP
jgi:hypothetical protein